MACAKSLQYVFVRPYKDYKPEYGYNRYRVDYMMINTIISL